MGRIVRQSPADVTVMESRGGGDIGGETSEEGLRGVARRACRGSGRGLCTGVDGCVRWQQRGAPGAWVSGFGTLTATRGVLPEKQVCGVWHHLPPSDAHGTSTCHCSPNATETSEDTDS